MIFFIKNMKFVFSMMLLYTALKKEEIAIRL